jgi:hypothetical protein
MFNGGHFTHEFGARVIEAKGVDTQFGDLKVARLIALQDGEIPALVQLAEGEGADGGSGFIGEPFDLPLHQTFRAKMGWEKLIELFLAYTFK